MNAQQIKAIADAIIYHSARAGDSQEQIDATLAKLGLPNPAIDLGLKQPTRRKSAKRSTVERCLRNLLGANWFLRTTEDFSGSVGGIWTTNETASSALGEEVIYSIERCEEHPKVKALLEACGWFIEPHDSGTLMIWPINS